MRLSGWIAAAITALGAAAFGCASTEFIPEGPGQPSDRASGQVPEGALGACKVPGLKRPPIVSERLWNDARPCTPRTPDRFVRLGYGVGHAGATTEADADKMMDRLLGVLRDGKNEDVGNNQLVSTLRSLHDNGLKDPYLRDRVSRETARTSVCDYTYLFNTMARERAKLAEGNRCAASAYDPAARHDECLFETSRDEVVWLTSSWSCVTHTGAVGEAQSCFRLCGYDDYCAKQVACTAPDVDLLLCAMGVCLPEPRAGVR